MESLSLLGCWGAAFGSFFCLVLAVACLIKDTGQSLLCDSFTFHIIAGDGLLCDPCCVSVCWPFNWKKAGWSSFRNHCQGSAAPFIALLINAYAWIDVIAMMPSVLDFIFRDDAQLGPFLSTLPSGVSEIEKRRRKRRKADPAAPRSSAPDCPL